MRGFGLLKPLVWLMAPAAYLPLRLGEDSGRIAAVRIMTGQTIACFEGFMIRPARLQFHHVIVAFAAKLGTGSNQHFRFRRTMPFMAGDAVTGHNRFVRECLHEFGLGIRMTRKAEFVAALFGHVHEIRSVRIMAAQAFAAFKRIMRGFVLESFLCLGVTGIAEFAPLLVNQPLELSRMRLVARQAAGAGSHGSMLEGRHRPLLLVAIKAEFVAILGKQPGRFR